MRLTHWQETAKLEAQAFELEQKTALATEAKMVLDSWVRYEGQVKNRQQKELADSVIAKITKELENPKVLQQILQQSVADVESESDPTATDILLLTGVFRDRPVEGTIEYLWRSILQPVHKTSKEHPQFRNSFYCQ